MSGPYNAIAKFGGEKLFSYTSTVSPLFEHRSVTFADCCGSVVITKEGYVLGYNGHENYKVHHQNLMDFSWLGGNYAQWTEKEVSKTWEQVGGLPGYPTYASYSTYLKNRYQWPLGTSILETNYILWNMLNKCSKDYTEVYKNSQCLMAGNVPLDTLKEWMHPDNLPDVEGIEFLDEDIGPVSFVWRTDGNWGGIDGEGDAVYDEDYDNEDEE